MSMQTWIRYQDSGWHWYSRNGCGAGWALNMWDGKAEIKAVDTQAIGSLPDGNVCPECVGAVKLFLHFKSTGGTAPTMTIPYTGPAIEARPVIVCLCGSTRFYEQFQQANFEETMQGKIVLSVGFYPHNAHVHGEGVNITLEQKVALDELHKRKIDLADEIFVLNVGGYVGESTRSEIEYALATGKPVRYLEAQTTE